MIADRLDNMQVGALVFPADVVGFAQHALLGNKGQGASVILDIKPVADIEAIPIHWHRFAEKTLNDHVRDKLLRKLVRPIIVGAIGDQNRKPIGMMPRADEMV